MLKASELKLVKIAAIQFSSAFGKPKENRQRLMELIKLAALKEAKIVVMPETAVPGYMSYGMEDVWQAGKKKLSTSHLKGHSVQKVAETVPGPSSRIFSKLCKDLKIYLALTLIEKLPDRKKYYNTSLIISPQGSIVVHYRKRNPWPFAEKGWADDGDLGVPYVDTEYGRLGTIICYDIHSELKTLKKNRVNTLLYPIAWSDFPGSKWFTNKLPAKAKRYHINIIAANWTAPKNPDDWGGYGYSRIIDYKGTTLAQISDNLKEDIVFAQIPQ